MESEKLYGEQYRDSIATITKDGKRAWIYAKRVKGTLYTYRKLFGYALLAFLFIVPFIKIGGEPLLLFNVLERRFILLGVIFWPQDSFLFYLMMVSTIIFVVLFTVMFGRLFCGWACPQTIFLELVFRPLEWLIDGTPSQQRKLKEQPWTIVKILKRLLKHGIFFGISFLIANALLSFIIGADNVLKIASEPISEHRSSFIAMIVFTAAFYFIYAFFREQVCTIMCPYGRLQGVLTDKDTILVSYDYYRGEPRGAAKKKESESKLGDCIDCKECIRVCPTGIDIRNGTQLECVNCTACIDACNGVMKKVNKPTGLIRYSSENGLKNGKSFRFTVRNIAYSVVLLGILIFLGTLLITRPDTQTSILRSRGQTFQLQPDNQISNLYNINIANKTRTSMKLEIRVLSPKGVAEVHGADMTLESGASIDAVLLVKLDRTVVIHRKTPIVFGLFNGDQLVETIETDFLGSE